MTTQDKLADALRGIVELGKRDLTSPKYDGYFDAAREALAAHDAQPAPGGWVWVPREATQAMVETGRHADDLACRHNARRVYNAMLAAAPQTAPAPVQVDGAGELPPLPHGDAFCDIADWSEESIGMCGAWSEHLSINSRYTMPLYTESSVRTYTRAAIAALRQPVPPVTDEDVKAAWGAFDGQFYEDRAGQSAMDRMRKTLESYRARLIAPRLQAQQPAKISREWAKNAAERELEVGIDFDAGVEQQPGAQAVGYISLVELQSLDAARRDDANFNATVFAKPTGQAGIAVYTQPPSIPEPSEEDVEEVSIASGLPIKFPNDRKRVVDALATYTARLRERLK